MHANWSDILNLDLFVLSLVKFWCNSPHELFTNHGYISNIYKNCFSALRTHFPNLLLSLDSYVGLRFLLDLYKGPIRDRDPSERVQGKRAF